MCQLPASIQQPLIVHIVKSLPLSAGSLLFRLLSELPDKTTTRFEGDARIFHSSQAGAITTIRAHRGHPDWHPVVSDSPIFPGNCLSAFPATCRISAM